MKWTAEYATGVEKVDEHHRMIFRMAEDFRAALDEGQGNHVYGLLLDSLEAFAHGHFRFEEQCTRNLRCPIADENEEAHKEFLRIFQGFKDRFRERGFDPEDGHSLVDFLDRWLDEHICRLDIHLRDCVRKGALPG